MLRRARAPLIVWAELVRPAVCVFASVAVGATTAWAGGRLLARHEVLALVFIAVIAVLGGVGGLYSLRLLADTLEFVLSGYRIRQLPPREYFRATPGPKLWVYEERTTAGGVRQMSFMRESPGDGNPAHTIVRIPPAHTWETRAPEWARERRTEIVRRIAECAGDKTEFADEPN
jgi:hypothetical protein